MSKNLAKLLDQPEKLVAKAVDKLEGLNGYPSEDARLLADNSQAVRQKVADLGLDPDDTTGHELYRALLNKYETDTKLVDKALGVSADSTFGQKAYKAGKLLSHIGQVNDIWVLKYASAKKLLRQQPPKKLIKQMGYRSADSFLKHEKIEEAFSVLQFVESASWQKDFAKKLSRLDGTNFESRKPKLISPDVGHWKINLPKKAVSTNSQIGTINIWPSAKVRKASTLSLALMMFDGLEQLTHSDTDLSIAQLNPALVWWAQSQNLIAICDGETVSMNFKDVAANHFNQATYDNRARSSARQSLWTELSNRYQKQQAALEVATEDLEQQATDLINKIPKVKAQPKLASEYAEAIANEF